MSEQVFDKVSKGKLEFLKTDRKVYAYASKEPLNLSGKCILNICVPDTQTSLKTESFVMPGTADTLLGRSSSEELGVLKVGVNACKSRNTAGCYLKDFVRSKLPLGVSFTIPPITSVFVLDSLRHLRTGKAAGLDGLGGYFLKLSAPSIESSLTIIFNLSLSSGSFPDLWKNASI